MTRPPHPDDSFAPRLVRLDPTSPFGSPVELIVPGAVVVAAAVYGAWTALASGLHGGWAIVLLVFGCLAGLLATGLYFSTWGLRWWFARRRFARQTGEPYLRPWQRRGRPPRR